MKTCFRCKLQHSSKRIKFCSEECFAAHRKEYCKLKSGSASNLTERICPHCSNKHMRNKHKKGNFCNRRCASKYYIENATFDAWRVMSPERRGVYTTCVACGKEGLYVPPRNVGNNETRLCGRECWPKFMADLTRDRGGPPNKGKRTSEKSKQRQRETLIKKHGVPNGFLVKQQGNKSKRAKEFYEALKLHVRDDLECEQLIEARYYADVRVKDEKTLVEFYGDYWHANPAVYADDFWNDRKKLYAKDIRQRDAERKRWLEERGYRVLIVWERDWNSQQESVVDFLQWSMSESGEKV